MTMSPNVRKLMLVVHVSTSIGWIGAVAGFLALAVTGLHVNPHMLRGVYPAMQIITLTLPAGITISHGSHGSPGAELVVHAAGGILVLLAAAVLSIYKPRGMTKFGRRRAANS